MPMNKNGAAAPATQAATPAVETPKVEAPKIETSSAKLLGESKSLTGEKESKRSGGRDFDAEAKGKVGCAAFVAALQSPGIAALPFTDVDSYLKLVTKAADAAVDYTWKHQNGK